MKFLVLCPFCILKKIIAVVSLIQLLKFQKVVLNFQKTDSRTIFYWIFNQEKNQNNRENWNDLIYQYKLFINIFSVNNWDIFHAGIWAFLFYLQKSYSFIFNQAFTWVWSSGLYKYENTIHSIISSNREKLSVNRRQFRNKSILTLPI